MITSKQIKEKAKELGAYVCGIGDIKHFIGDDPMHNPLSILPTAKCIIGVGVPVPKGLINAMDSKSQFYNYTNLGVKYIDETFAEILLLKLGAFIEDEGYDACLQRSVPGFRVKGDKSCNPEVNKIYELQFASPVSADKPTPDVIIDYNKAGVVCGLGSIGLHNKLITKGYGTFMRFFYIITDMPLECDSPFAESLCDKCGKCKTACPGKAIDDNGLDTWQCAVYYRGAHKSNPFMTDKFLQDEPDREQIINGEKKFDSESAKEILPKLNFLPNTHFGYVACLCSKSCEVACYNHLKEKGTI